jgi:p24 family protein delta-1
VSSPSPPYKPNANTTPVTSRSPAMAARRLGSPASRWLRPSALLLLVASALLSAPSPARALRFDLESGHTKCVSDEIKVNAMAVGKYHIVGPDPNSPDAQLPESHRISLRVSERAAPSGNSVIWLGRGSHGDVRVMTGGAFLRLMCR